MEQQVKKKRSNRILCVWFMIFFVVSFLLTGCGQNVGKMKVVLTTGFSKNEVFRIEEVSCTVPEIMVYLTNIQNRYEVQLFGTSLYSSGT